MINTREIKAQMKRAGKTQAEIAHEVNMDPSTLNRKINNSTGNLLTVNEALRIAQALNIEGDSMRQIFFASELTETQVSRGNGNGAGV